MIAYALVDCNNFYASCERVFQPKLTDRPIVVLSNNDGCVIARSQEAKDLGIEMTAPLFKIRGLVDSGKVVVRSSNYALYGDMSARVMNLLTEWCGDVEPYSIDEAFVAFNFHDQNEKWLLEKCRTIRADLLRYTGIPVSIGIASTKTLGKLANHVAKKGNYGGVFSFLDESKHEAVLSKIPVGKVWGIGAGREKKLLDEGYDTAWELRNIDLHWARRQMTVIGERIVKELRGEPCFELELPSQVRKHLMVTRSFQKDITEFDHLKEALSTHASRLGEKLRQTKQRAGSLSVYLKRNKHKEKLASGYYHQSSIELSVPTSDTLRITQIATDILRQVYKPGVRYKKCGIMAGELSYGGVQSLLLDKTAEVEVKRSDLMRTLDQLNAKLGRNTVRLGSTANPSEAAEWDMRQAYRSRRCTTNWQELLEVESEVKAGRSTT
ncbi:MAG: Y-family DNA polymerase [Bacteroidota bacterium]